jgi:hypothetical protein
MKAFHPFFEPAMVCVHILNVKHLVSATPLFVVECFECHTGFFGKFDERPRFIYAQYAFLGDIVPDFPLYALGASIRQYGIASLLSTVSDNDDRNLFSGKSTCLAFSASFPGWTVVYLCAFVGLQEIRLVYLGYAETTGLMLFWACQKSVPPTESCCPINAATLRCLC